MTHYHVSRHREDDDVFVTDDLYQALDYAADELNTLAEMEYAFVSEMAQKVSMHNRMFSSTIEEYPAHPADMEDALRSFHKHEILDALYQNAKNMVKQNNTGIRVRAPLYRADTYAEEAKVIELLRQSAGHVAESINRDSPIEIWDCSAETGVWPEGWISEPLVSGQSYCKDEYPEDYS